MSLRQTVRRETAVLSGNRDAVVSLCLFNGWVFAFNWSGSFELPFIPSLLGLEGNGLWLISLTVCTLVLGVFYAIRPLHTQASGRTAWLACVSLVASVALLALAAQNSLFSESTRVALSVAGGVASGFGTGLLSCCWGALAIRFNPGVLLQMLAVSLLFSAALVFLTSLLPGAAVWAVLCVTAFFCAFAYVRALGGKTTSLDRGDGWAKGSDPSPAGFSFLGLVLLLGVSGGLLRGLVGADVQSAAGINAFVVATLVASAALLLSKLPEQGEPFSLFYKVIAVMAAGFMVLGLLAGTTQLALAIHSAGFTYFYGLLWALCCLYAVSDRFPMRVFIGGLLFDQVGQVLGAIIGTGVTQLAGEGTAVAAVSNTVVYVLLFTSVALLAKLSRPKAAVDAEDAQMQNRPAKVATLEQACEAAAARYNLTKRESEVLLFLLKGYDRAYIAQEMGLSNETIKTHTRHIYEKAGVHTRAELLSATLEL